MAAQSSCSAATSGSGWGMAKPLTPAEYHAFAEWLERHSLTPASLLGTEGALHLDAYAGNRTDSARIARMLDREAELDAALAMWENHRHLGRQRTGRDVSLAPAPANQDRRISPSVRSGAEDLAERRGPLRGRLQGLHRCREAIRPPARRALRRGEHTGDLQRHAWYRPRNRQRDASWRRLRDQRARGQPGEIP